MNSGRFTWFACLALVVIVTATVQFRVQDACEAAESDVSLSASDDSLAIATEILPEVSAPTAARPRRFDARLPSERLADADVFRPPTRFWS